MSEPTITIDHQATLQPAPTQVAPVPPTPVQQPPTSINEYQSPLATPTLAPPGPTPEAQNSYQPQTPSPSPAQSSSNLAAAERFPGVVKPLPEEVVVAWESPSRPHKQRQKQYFTTIAIFVVLLGLILFFLSQFLLIGVVLAVAFLVYVLEVVPPTMVSHQITTYGIRIENNLYYWEELGRFWFTEKYGQKMLHVEVGRFPGRLTLLLGDLPEEDMKDLLSEVLLYQKPAPTAFEKAADRLQQLIPLEND